MRLFHSFLALLPFSMLVACSASSDPVEATDATESELQSVDFTKCPRELRVQVGAGFQAIEVGVVDAYRPTLHTAELNRLASAVHESVEAWPTINVEAAVIATTAHSCTYAQAPNTVAVLRNRAGGGVELEITRAHLRVLAPVKRYAPEGLRFAENTRVELSAIISGANEPRPRYVAIGKTEVDTTGEQIARYASLSALRIPVLDSSLSNLHEYDPAFEETMVIDREHAPMKYARYVERMTALHYVDVLSRANPAAFKTSDPDTSICFLGPANGVCEIMSTFSGTVFSDGFSISNTGAGESCTETDTAVYAFYRTTESPQLSFLSVPRCR